MEMTNYKQMLNGESGNASGGKLVLTGESGNASKGKQTLKVESGNASKDKQILEPESSNTSIGKQMLNGESGNEVSGNPIQSGDTSKGIVILVNAGSTVQATNNNRVDIESSDTIQKRSHSRNQANHGSSKFWVCLRWSFFIICFCLEVISVVLEKLSSQENHIYALVGMVVSIITLILCIAELVTKGKKEKVTWKRRENIYWFYDPDNKRFGTFPDIFGLIFGVLEVITSTMTYALFLRDKNNPIDLPFCSIVFAALLLCSKYPIDQDVDDPLIMETV